MEKENFKQKMEQLEHARQKALEFNRRETDKLCKQYITENCKFQIGDTVMLDGQKGVIEDIKVSNDGRFFGDWRKFKKNGEPHLMAHSFSSIEYVCMLKV